jgi:hypothetical protein
MVEAGVPGLEVCGPNLSAAAESGGTRDRQERYAPDGLRSEEEVEARRGRPNGGERALPLLFAVLMLVQKMRRSRARDGKKRVFEVVLDAVRVD